MFASFQVSSSRCAGHQTPLRAVTCGCCGACSRCCCCRGPGRCSARCCCRRCIKILQHRQKIFAPISTCGGGHGGGGDGCGRGLALADGDMADAGVLGLLAPGEFVKARALARLKRVK